MQYVFLLYFSAIHEYVIEIALAGQIGLTLLVLKPEYSDKARF